MDKRPRSLRRRDRFIEGIYSYCDRWCARCPLSDRCRVYDKERRSGIDPDRSNVDLGEALQHVRRSYEKTWRLWRRATTRLNIPLALSDQVDPEIDAAEARLTGALDRDPVSVDARKYFSLVQEWFALERPWFDARAGAIERAMDAGGDPGAHAERAMHLYEQVLVIRHYEGFVGAKVRRALGRLARYDPEIEDRVQNDANGSAKVALLAIERSVPSLARACRVSRGRVSIDRCDGGASRERA